MGQPFADDLLPRKNPNNYLLIFEVSHNATNSLSSSLSIGDLYSYTTDDFFSWLDDGEGVNYGANKPDISIGRFPCPTTAEAAVMVNKSIAYLTGANQGTWQSRAYVLGDDKDNNLHMRGAEDVANSITSTTGGNLLLHKSYWDAYKRTYTATGYSYPQATRDLQRAMREGALLFDYVGHGSPDQVSHARVLVKDDFSDNQTSSLPLWILASCKISPYDMPQSDIGRSALFNPNGGAVAVLCASRSVFAERNVELNTRFCRFLLKRAVSLPPSEKPCSRQKRRSSRAIPMPPSISSNMPSWATLLSLLHCRATQWCSTALTANP